MTHTPGLNSYPKNQLVPSIADEGLADFLIAVGDTSLDAAIDSGALDGVPVVGLFTGLLKAYKGLSENWRVRKLAIFLSQVSEIPSERRKAFSAQFTDEHEREEFGGALLVLVERAEDLDKPRVLGRLLAAHVAGSIGSVELIRLSRMVDRCFFEDLKMLQGFAPGFPPRGGEIAAEGLSAIGFLANIGFDGGGRQPDGTMRSGLLYALTPYGESLVKYGLEDDSL